MALSSLRRISQSVRDCCVLSAEGSRLPLPSRCAGLASGDLRPTCLDERRCWVRRSLILVGVVSFALLSQALVWSLRLGFLYGALQPDVPNADAVSGCVPRRIHQIFGLKGDGVMPANWEPTVRTWQQTYSAVAVKFKDGEPQFNGEGWQHVFWGKEEVESLIKNRYSARLWGVYEAYPSWVQRADLARLVVVHAHGGLYSDMDIRPRSAPTFESIVKECPSAVVVQTGPPTGTWLSNDFFMFQKGSAALGYMIAKLEQRPTWKPKVAYALQPYLTIMGTTGPMWYTFTFLEYSNQNPFPAGKRLILANYGGRVRHTQGSTWHDWDVSALTLLLEVPAWGAILVVASLFAGATTARYCKGLVSLQPLCCRVVAFALFVALAVLSLPAPYGYGTLIWQF